MFPGLEQNITPTTTTTTTTTNNNGCLLQCFIFFFMADAGQTWMEVAYGTDRGGVRVIVRHPENIGHTPQLFQSYNVHSNPVSKVVLGEKHLVSGNFKYMCI